MLQLQIAQRLTDKPIDRVAVEERVSREAQNRIGFAALLKHLNRPAGSRIGALTAKPTIPHKLNRRVHEVTSSNSEVPENQVANVGVGVRLAGEGALF